MKNCTFFKVGRNTPETVIEAVRGEIEASSDTLEISLIKKSLIEVESQGTMHVCIFKNPQLGKKRWQKRPLSKCLFI
jgi:hypothetical protein